MRTALLVALAAAGVVPTELGRLAVAPADAVVLARVERVWNAGPRAAIARLAVDEVLAGDPPDDATLLCYPGEFREGDRDLLFLTHTRGGARLQVLRRLSASDPDFAQKVAVTRRTIALARLDGGDVVAATLAALVGWVEDGPAWTRAYALRELHALVPEHAVALDATLRARLAALAARPASSWLPPAGETPESAGHEHVPPGGFAWEPLAAGASTARDALPAPSVGHAAAAGDPDAGVTTPSRDEAARAAAEDVANSLRRLLESLQSPSSSLPPPASREQSPR